MVSCAVIILTSKILHLLLFSIMLINKGIDLKEVFSTVKHELHRGVLDNKHPFRFVVLGTLAETGPDARYVVLRMIDEQLNFFIYTDQRTGKAKSIEIEPRVSLLFYSPQKRVQVRVKGTAVLHHGNEEAQKHWNRVQGLAQKAYHSRLAPGSVLDRPEDAYAWSDQLDEPDYFSVIQVKPLELEVLQLDGLEHLRAKFTINDGIWDSSWLAP